MSFGALRPPSNARGVPSNVEGCARRNRYVVSHKYNIH